MHHFEGYSVRIEKIDTESTLVAAVFDRYRFGLETDAQLPESFVQPVDILDFKSQV